MGKETDPRAVYARLFGDPQGGRQNQRLEDRRLLAFVPAASYPVGTGPQAVVSADFTNDTLEDLAVANYSSSSVSVLPCAPASAPGGAAQTGRLGKRCPPMVVVWPAS